ncbi:hypothetical protein OS493_002629 [Desmophyllum pertusum]|uniref:Uncharacterized protein n=1 Tax=Desmophyllum pertusum TaxID=174260 RepID=A0A9W9YUQ8_9CNID|nr:hypothetical protein OS493_002629 [Desmophyllum pertusum]
MEKSELKSLDCLAAGTERDSKLFSVLNSSILRDFFMGHNLPWKEDVEDDEESSELVSGTKSEPQSPTSCCQSIFESLELGREPDISISVDFPDLKPLYHKTQSRVNRQSRQRVVKGKIKVRVTTRGHQLQTIEVYVERTPDAAHLVGDKCGRVYLKPQTGPYFPSKYFFTVDLDSVYESPKKHGVPVYKLSTVDFRKTKQVPFGGCCGPDW